MIPYELTEYLECSKDVNYFMKRYIKIDHPTEGTIDCPLEGFYRNELNPCVLNSKRLFLTAPRQTGKSTLCVVKALHAFLFKHDYTTYLISNKHIMCDTMMRRFTRMYSQLPSFLRFSMSTNKSDRIATNEYCNNKIRFLSNKAVNRGAINPNLIIIDGDMATEINPDLDPYLFTDSVDVFSTSGGQIIDTKKYNNFDHYQINSQDMMRWTPEYKDRLLTILGFENFKQQYG